MLAFISIEFELIDGIKRLVVHWCPYDLPLATSCFIHCFTLERESRKEIWKKTDDGIGFSTLQIFDQILIEKKQFFL